MSRDEKLIAEARALVETWRQYVKRCETAANNGFDQDWSLVNCTRQCADELEALLSEQAEPPCPATCLWFDSSVKLQCALKQGHDGPHAYPLPIVPGPEADKERAMPHLSQDFQSLNAIPKTPHEFLTGLSIAQQPAPAVSDSEQDLRHTLDLIRESDMRAIRMWQEAHPEKKHVWPDRGNMIFWLLEREAQVRSDRDMEWWEKLACVDNVAPTPEGVYDWIHRCEMKMVRDEERERAVRLTKEWFNRPGVGNALSLLVELRGEQP